RLPELLRRNGLRRARQFDRAAWREQFGRVIDAVLDAPPRVRADALEILPRTAMATASAQQAELVIPVRLTNRGQHAEAADGPGRTELVAAVLGPDGEPAAPLAVTPLPGLLVPGRPVAAVVRVNVPAEPGEYEVTITARRHGVDAGRTATLRLTVTATAPEITPPTIPANLEPTLQAAAAAQRLPDGYADVSLGRLGRLKRWVKHKLLHNFQTAYVDVLSRQQSAFNQQVVTALAELGDSQAALAHAAALQPPRPARADDPAALRAELRRLRRRLARLEAALPPAGPYPEESAA